MRFFNVIVSVSRVGIEEQMKPHKMYDAKAFVDGMPCLYRIKKHKDCELKRSEYRSLGMTALHYDAMNRGTVVRFEPVRITTHKKSEISEDQLSFDF